MIDLHCDTVGRLAAEGNDGSLLKNSYSVDVERLEKENTLLQCFSTFFDAGAYPEETREEQSYITANRMIDIFDENVKLCGGRLLQVKTYEDILKCQAENKVGGLLTFEDGVSVGHDMKNLHYFYDRGIRLITLTWNYENAIGYPNSRIRKQCPGD